MTVYSFCHRSELLPSAEEIVTQLRFKRVSTTGSFQFPNIASSEFSCCCAEKRLLFHYGVNETALKVTFFLFILSTSPHFTGNDHLKLSAAPKACCSKETPMQVR